MKVIMPVVKAEFGLFEVQSEVFCGYPIELGEPLFGGTPERLDTVDVVVAPCKLIDAMVDSEVLVKAQVSQAASLPDVVLRVDPVPPYRYRLDEDFF